jgi:hypothetical protein
MAAGEAAMSPTIFGRLGKGCPRPEPPSRRILVDPRSKVVQARAKKLAKDLLRASTGRLGEALCPPSTKLVIFSRGRTGSNLLAWLLKSHPQIRHHGEVLGETCVRHDCYRNEINRIGVVPYFERVTRRFFTERVVGVKFLYYQLEPEYALRWNVPDIPNLLPVLEARKDLRIIHLKRRNRLATLVSWKLAQHTDSWEAFRAGRRSRSVQSRDSMYRETTSTKACREVSWTALWLLWDRHLGNPGTTGGYESCEIG